MESRLLMNESLPLWATGRSLLWGLLGLVWVSFHPLATVDRNVMR